MTCHDGNAESLEHRCCNSRVHPAHNLYRQDAAVTHHETSASTSIPHGPSHQLAHSARRSSPMAIETLHLQAGRLLPRITERLMKHCATCCCQLYLQAMGVVCVWVVLLSQESIPKALIGLCERLPRHKRGWHFRLSEAYGASACPDTY